MKTPILQNDIQLNESDIELFGKKLYEALYYIDMDSPRFVDFIWNNRAQAALHTAALQHTFPNKDQRYAIADLMPLATERFLEDIAKECFISSYQSDSIWRRMYVKDGVIRLQVTIARQDSECTIIAIGDPEVVTPYITNVRDHFREPNSITITQLNGFSGDGSPIANQVVFREDEDEVYLAKDEFYPFIEGGINKLIEDYKKSRASVLFFIGPPGTGKTTLLRTILFKMGMKQNIAIAGESTLMSPALMPFISNSNKGTVIAIEDSDMLCTRREDGNHQMSALLNYADGIGFTGNKLVISTNLSSLNKVDPALIRDGRSFKVIEFRELVGEEVNKARKSIGLEELDSIGEDEKVRLASALLEDYEERIRAKTYKGFAD